MDWTFLLALIVLGGTIGFLAGLLGIGGGLSMVPLLTILFSAHGFAPQHVVHLAVGTATATIAFTALSSARAHQRKGAVLWPIVIAMAPGIVVGALIGPQVASILPTRVFATIFGIFVWVSALRMASAKPAAAQRPLPGRTGLFGVGAGIGFVSSLIGAGGAFISIPFMERRAVSIQKAVATSAAIGVPIAAVAAIGFVLAGLHKPGLPNWSLGFIYLPAMLAIVVASMLVAPLGATVAHRWPAMRLRRLFAILLLGLGGYMFWKAAHA